MYTVPAAKFGPALSEDPLESPRQAAGVVDRPADVIGCCFCFDLLHSLSYHILFVFLSDASESENYDGALSWVSAQHKPQ